MRRLAASLLLALAAIGAPGMAGTVGAVDIEGGACSLVTNRELTRAFGGRRWQEAEGGPVDPLSCYRHNDMLGRRSKAVLVKFTPAAQEQSDSFRQDFLSSYPGSELEVGGFPAVQDGGTLHVFVGPQGWLSVEMSSESGRDYGRLPDLAELAVGRLDPSLLQPVDPAEEPAGDLCLIVAVEAVSAAVGEPVTIIEQAADSCTLAGDVAAGSGTSVTIQLATGDPLAVTPLIDQVGAAFPDAAEIELGDVPALQPEAQPGSPGFMTAQLVVFPDPATVLFLMGTTPDTVDVAAALVTIAEQALTALAAPPAS